MFPTLAQNSAGIVSRIMMFSPRPSNIFISPSPVQDYLHPTFWSDEDDPLYTVHCNRPWGRCSVEGLQVRIPQAAKSPPTNNDGHMTVIEQWNNWEWDFYETQTPLPAGGGTVNIGWGGRTDITGDGLGTGEAVAAEWGNLAGIIRSQEAISGVVNHALFMVLSCGSNSPEFVYPATKGGAFCPDQTNAPPMGTHLWLDLTDPDIDALSIPAWQKMLLKTLHNYGAFMGDTGGAGFQFQFESPFTYNSFAGRVDPGNAWAQANGWSFNNTYGWIGNWSNVPSSVWTHLHVLDPCVSRGTC